MTLACPAHGMFATQDEFAKHMALEHNVSINNLPTPEFEEEVLRIEKGRHRVKELDMNIKPPPILKPEDVQPGKVIPGAPVNYIPVKREAKPIELHYKYFGECPTCFTEVKTLEIEVAEEGMFSEVAFCLSCNKQLQDKKVSKIDTLTKRIK